MKNCIVLNCNVRMIYFIWGFLGVYLYGMFYLLCEERFCDLYKVFCLNEIVFFFGEDLICVCFFLLGIIIYL